MRTPKYRFLLGTHLQATGNYNAGYYDKITGNLVTGGDEMKYASVAYVGIEGMQAYLAADNTFLKSNSYITLYAGNLFIGAVQLSDIMGVPYAIPQGTTRIGITIDVTEKKTEHPRPVYVLAEFNAVYSKLNKKISRESGQIFFRETLDTDLHFVGASADYIILRSVRDRFMAICERWNFSNGTWSVYHADMFNVTDCKFDLATHTCTPQLTVLDNYSKILARYSDEYDLIKLKPAITQINTFLRPIIELYERGSSVITRFLGGTYWETEVNNPIDVERTLTDQEHFAKIAIGDEFAYLEVSFDESFSIDASNGRYSYDSVIQGYHLEKDGRRWTWEFRQGFGDILYLRLNGQPYTVNGSEIYIGVPSVTPSDLPLDNYAGNVYGTLGETFGTYAANRYYIYGRVVGNGDTLFGTMALDIPQDDFAISSQAYKKCVPLDKLQGFLYGTYDTSVEPTIYGIKENEGEYYTNENLPVEGGITGVKPMPIGKYEWGELSYWYNYDTSYVNAETLSRYQYKMKDCFTIGDTIRALLAELDSSIVFEDTTAYSEFLYGMPGMKGGYWWKLAITPKSNVLKGDYDQPARKAPITFEGLMNMLHDLYGLYWYIDDNRYLRIEHILWFINGGSYSAYTGSVQLNLAGNTCKDAYNKKRTAYWQYAYNFNMSEAARRLELDFAEDGTEFFNGLYIDVLNEYLTDAKVDSRSISNFTADIDLMRIEPSRYSSDGFAVLAYTTGQTPQSPQTEPVVPVTGRIQVTDNEGSTRDAYVNNAFASWLYCQHFLMYNLSGAIMKQSLQMVNLPNNQSLDSVHGLARLKRQEIQFPLDDDPDTIDLIATDVGSGMPEDFSVNALTRTVKATLSFPIEEVIN